MKQTLFIAVFAAAAASAIASTYVSPLTVITRLGQATTTFSCETSNGDDCHYLILQPLCQEKFLGDGVKERTCQYTQPVPPFRVRSGERKTVSRLSSDYLHAMKVGSAPTPDEVLRAPALH